MSEAARGRQEDNVRAGQADPSTAASTNAERGWGWGWRGGYSRGYWRGQGYYGGATEILRQRYAKGEITKDQFDQMMRDLKAQIA